MTTSLCSFLCLLTLGVSGNELVIDAMDYPNGPAARRAWTICPDAPPVAMVEDGGRRVLDVKAPFAARPKLTRVFVDRRVDLDLSVPGEFRLELSCDQPEVFNGITLYFRCGKGWYASNGGLVKRGWQTLTFAKSSFRAEGQPTGWHEIEQIRIAAWHGQSKDASLRLGRLTASWHNVVLVVPAGKTKEATDSRATARQMVAMLDEMKLGSNTIEEGALTGDALAKCRVAVLPYNPTLPAEAHDALVEFVQRGGKVFACYRLPHKLAEAIGFRSLKYIRPKREGRFAEIRFDARGIDGLPRSVRQASWNITTVEPVGYNARAIGHWFDDVGKPTGEGALWLSDRGAMFSHLILPDDREGKKRLLGGRAGPFVPSRCGKRWPRTRWRKPIMWATARTLTRSPPMGATNRRRKPRVCWLPQNRPWSKRESGSTPGGITRRSNSRARGTASWPKPIFAASPAQRAKPERGGITRAPAFIRAIGTGRRRSFRTRVST